MTNDQSRNTGNAEKLDASASTPLLDVSQVAAGSKAKGRWTDFASMGPHGRPDSESDDEWNRLRNSVDANKAAPIGAIVQWLYENASTPPEELALDSIPSRGALRHLQLIQSGESEYKDFVDAVWVKMMPSKSELERVARNNDDGSDLLSLLDEFDAGMEAEDQINAGEA